MKRKEKKKEEKKKEKCNIPNFCKMWKIEI